MNKDDRHPPVNPNPRVRFGPYEADFQTQEFWKDGVRTKLSGQPLQVLEVLLAKPGHLVTRAELQSRLWPEGTFTDFNHSLNAAVNKLREALDDSADHPRFIETLPRRGYRFIGAIAPLPWSDLPGPVSPNPVLVPLLPKDNAPIAIIPASPQPKVRTRFAALGAGLVIAGLIGAFVLRSSSVGGGARSQISAGSISTKQSADVGVDPSEQVQSKINAEASVIPSSHPGAFASDQSRTPRELGHEVLERIEIIIPGDSGNAAPQFSPDGRHIAFMSNRSGPWQVWVANADGSDPWQLSTTASAGTPRWSPDSRYIAYDAPSDEGTSIFVTAADDPQSRRQLVPGSVPSFSRDGKWIYFASDRSGDWQVWKVRVNGEDAQQVTYNGGFAALESTDGYLYYSKSRDANPEICRIAADTNDEECVLPHVRPRTWSDWAVTRGGILFVEEIPNGRSILSFYEPPKQQIRDVMTLQTMPHWVGATPDGKKIVVNDTDERQISMIENWR